MIGWGELRNAAWSVMTPFVGGRLIPWPFIMVLVVTRRCNSRCQMCNIWRGRSANDPSLDEIESILETGLTRSIRIVTLTGGEPTLRKDLGDILGLILTSCPHLEHLTLATNGLNPELTIEQVRRCVDRISLADAGLDKMVVQVSLDGIGEVHDKVRGVPGAYGRVLKTCQSLVELRNRCPMVHVVLSCVVQPDNVDNLRDIRELAHSLDMPVLFNPLIFSSHYYENIDQQPSLRLRRDQAMQASAFFEQLAATEASSRKLYYRDVSRMLGGGRRGRKCMMGVYGFVLESDGEVHPCMNCESVSFGNVKYQAFSQLWFDKRLRGVRAHVRESCCPTCSSSCYTLPVNAMEVGSLLVGRLKRL